MLDLVPGFRRIAYASFYARGKDLKKNKSVFENLVKCIKKRDPEKAEQILRNYLLKEMATAIKAVDKWQKLKETGKDSLF